MGQEHRWRSGMACLADEHTNAVQIEVTMPDGLERSPVFADSSCLLSQVGPSRLTFYDLKMRVPTRRTIIFYPQIGQISTDSILCGNLCSSVDQYVDSRARSLNDIG